MTNSPKLPVQPGGYILGRDPDARKVIPTSLKGFVAENIRQRTAAKLAMTRINAENSLKASIRKVREFVGCAAGDLGEECFNDWFRNSTPVNALSSLENLPELISHDGMPVAVRVIVPLLSDYVVSKVDGKTCYTLKDDTHLSECAYLAVVPVGEGRPIYLKLDLRPQVIGRRAYLLRPFTPSEKFNPRTATTEDNLRKIVGEIQLELIEQSERNALIMAQFEL